MITFEYEKETNKKPTFGDVEDNQFFLDCDGSLCQKSDEFSYVMIASSKGEPLSIILDSNLSDSINKILPKVKKITW